MGLILFRKRWCCARPTMLHLMLQLGDNVCLFLIEIDLNVVGNLYLTRQKLACFRSAQFFLYWLRCSTLFNKKKKAKQNEKRKQWNHIRWFQLRIFTQTGKIRSRDFLMIHHVALTIHFAEYLSNVGTCLWTWMCMVNFVWT